MCTWIYNSLQLCGWCRDKKTDKISIASRRKDHRCDVHDEDESDHVIYKLVTKETMLCYINMLNGLLGHTTVKMIVIVTEIKDIKITS